MVLPPQGYSELNSEKIAENINRALLKIGGPAAFYSLPPEVAADRYRTNTHRMDVAPGSPHEAMANQPAGEEVNIAPTV